MTQAVFRACVGIVCALAIFAAGRSVLAQDAGILGPSASAPAGTPSRLESDVLALANYRPGYQFWRHIFTISDGSIAFGGASDGRLLAVFPSRGDWTDESAWKDPALAAAIETGAALPS